MFLIQFSLNNQVLKLYKNGRGFPFSSSKGLSMGGSFVDTPVFIPKDMCRFSLTSTFFQTGPVYINLCDFVNFQNILSK